MNSRDVRGKGGEGASGISESRRRPIELIIDFTHTPEFASDGKEVIYIIYLYYFGKL